MKILKNALLIGAVCSFFLASCTYKFNDAELVDDNDVNTIDTTVIYSFKDTVYPIFISQGCLMCHKTNGSASSYLDLNDVSTAYNSIISKNLVDTLNPINSKLYTKPSPDGSHPGKYKAAQLKLVRNWIGQGAKNN